MSGRGGALRQAAKAFHDTAKALADAAAALDPPRNSLADAANDWATRAQTVAKAATTLARVTPDASTEAAFSLAKTVLILRQDTTAFAQAPQPVTALALARTATALAEAVTAWAQDPVQVKTICRFIQREVHKEATKRNIIRELIKHENILFAQRRSPFTILQGLMWASAPLLVQSDYSKVNANLIYTLAGAGALLALVSAVSLFMTGFAISRLIKNTRVDPANQGGSGQSDE